MCLDVLAEQQRGAWAEDGDPADWAPQNADALSDPDALTALREEILGLLSYTPQHRDDLLRELQPAPGLFADAMLELVLTGAIDEHSGGRFSLSADDA